MYQTKIQLEEKDIPKQWYNVVADMETPPPPPINLERESQSVPMILLRSFLWDLFFRK